MVRIGLPALGFLAIASFTHSALAVSSGELYTSAAYGYGRFEARLRFAAGDGVVSSFFLWKDGSEVAGTFWNELDFEKVGADCHVETNAIHGNPVGNHTQRHTIVDPCGTYHTYTYEWTPDAIVWLVDGVEIRREGGAIAAAYAQNAQAMQLRFNVWPGDATFGGNFSPSILPVHQYVDWVQYSSYEAGAFAIQWRQDFDAQTLPEGWLTASWESPKNLSTHAAGNVNFLGGHLVISLTADNAIGPAGAVPGDGSPSGGAPSNGGAAGGPGRGGSSNGGSSGAGAGGRAEGGSSPSGGNASSSGGVASGGMTTSSGGIATTGGVATSSGGSAVGGAAVSAGAPPTSAGSSGTVATGGTAPSSGTGGTSGVLPPPTPSPPADSKDGGGCSLNARSVSHPSALLAMLGSALLLRLRRRARI